MFERLALDGLPLDPVIRTIYDDYVVRFGTERKRGIYRYKNFPRFSHVLQLLMPGDSVLDVGVFTGQFLDGLAMSNKWNHVVGIDIVKKPGFHTLSENYEFHIADCRVLPFDDKAFSAVVCMEVLEHLEVKDFPKALAELRRVCNAQLVISLPYNEQQPLSLHHRQAFDDEKLSQYFPEARGVILTERDKDVWVLLEEWLADRDH